MSDKLTSHSIFFRYLAANLLIAFVVGGAALFLSHQTINQFSYKSTYYNLQHNNISKNKLKSLSANNNYKEQLEKGFTRDLVITIIIGIVIALLLANLLTRSVTHIISHLTDTISELSKGRLNKRLSENLPTEFEEMARHINMMASDLDSILQDLTLERDELKTMVNTLQASLMVMNTSGYILMANPAFKKLTGKDKTTGKLYWEVIRDRELNNFLQIIRKKPDNYIQQLTVKEKFFLCSATYLKKRDKFILIFHDITPIQEVKRVKKDLVASVSHELRTPLTAIRGYIETLLEEEDDETKKHFLEIVDRHTKRLCKLVDDLLVLSEMENKGSLNTEAVDLSRLLAEIKELFGPRIEKKGLTLNISIEKDAEHINADEFKIQQMFTNLIDNAIKYTDKGHIDIKIIPRSKGGVKVSITDTGQGIPKQHLPYIFERFYVVDKSRCKKTGGTGLGLSIVKHIVELHGGMIEIKSQHGHGTCFTIFLPDPKSKNLSDHIHHQI